MARWNGGNVGREPITLNTQVDDLWEAEDELYKGSRYMRLRVSALIPWTTPHIVLAVQWVELTGSKPMGIYDAEDWPALCAWEAFDQSGYPRLPKPSIPRPVALLEAP